MKNKTIYLSGDEFEYQHLQDLQIEAQRYGIIIGDHVEIGNHLCVGSDSIIGEGCLIKEHCKIGEKSKIGKNSILLDDCELVSGSELRKNVMVKANTKISKYKAFYELEYIISIYIDENRSEVVIQLGRKIKFSRDWDDYFSTNTLTDKVLFEKEKRGFNYLKSLNLSTVSVLATS